jgi:hypothetical protein
MCLLHTIEPVPIPFGQCQFGAYLLQWRSSGNRITTDIPTHLLQWVGRANVDLPNNAPGYPNSSWRQRLGRAKRLVTLKCSTFKLKLTNTSMMMCKASMIDYLLVTDIFCCVMFICMTKQWNNLLLFGFAKLTYFVMLWLSVFCCYLKARYCQFPL